MRPRQNNNMHVKKGTLQNASDRIKKSYIKFNKVLRGEQYYKPISLLRFEPNDHYTSRNQLDGLAVSCKLLLHKIPYEGNLSSVNVVWKVPHDDHEAHNAKAMVYVAIQLPEFRSRQIQKNLIKK